MSPIAPTTPMWAERLPDRWGRRTKFTRREFGFLRCGSCAAAQIDREMLDLILLNVRTPKEREGDLESQIGACRVGEQRILEVSGEIRRMQSCRR